MAFGDVMSRPALSAIKARSILSSIEAQKHESTVTSYASVVDHLLKRYTTEPVITTADEKIRNLNKVLERRGILPKRYYTSPSGSETYRTYRCSAGFLLKESISALKAPCADGGRIPIEEYSRT